MFDLAYIHVAKAAIEFYPSVWPIAPKIHKNPELEVTNLLIQPLLGYDEPF